jgi:uncharacterized membrane protein
MGTFEIIIAIIGPIAGLLLLLTEKRDTLWSKFWFGMGFLNVFIIMPVNIIVHFVPWIVSTWG